jgi:serine/threonine protein kinase
MSSEDAPGPAVQSLASPGADLLGQMLEDRYRILRLIGRGGMGMVYEAEATRLGRRCAVKVLTPECTRSEDAALRFRREAQVVARVKHPNVVEIFDTGVAVNDSLLMGRSERPAYLSHNVLHSRPR